MGVLKYVVLTFLQFYKSWAIKLACKIDNLKMIKDNLWTCRILGLNWEGKNNDEFLKLAYPKAHIKDLIKFMNNNKEQDQIKKLCNYVIFLFIYNGVFDVNANSLYDSEKFLNT